MVTREKADFDLREFNSLGRRRSKRWSMQALGNTTGEGVGVREIRMQVHSG